MNKKRIKRIQIVAILCFKYLLKVRFPNCYKFTHYINKLRLPFRPFDFELDLLHLVGYQLFDTSFDHVILPLPIVFIGLLSDQQLTSGERISSQP